MICVKWPYVGPGDPLDLEWEVVYNLGKIILLQMNRLWREKFNSQ